MERLGNDNWSQFSQPVAGEFCLAAADTCSITLVLYRLIKFYDILSGKSTRINCREYELVFNLRFTGSQSISTLSLDVLVRASHAHQFRFERVFLRASVTITG